MKTTEERELREKFPDRGKSNEKLRIEKKKEKKIIIIEREREKRTSLPLSYHSLPAHVLVSCFLLNDTNIGRQSALSTTSPNTVQETSSKSSTVWSSQERTRRCVFSSTATPAAFICRLRLVSSVRRQSHYIFCVSLDSAGFMLERSNGMNGVFSYALLI